MRFSLDSYRTLLGHAIDGAFKPASFKQVAWPGRTLLLRHDVDYSLEMAVRLARVNAELGIVGTFFILARGHAYNPMSRASVERIEELVVLGQRLGLHVASGDDNIARDFEYLSAQFPLEPVFSWHNPTPAMLEKHREREVIAGLTNVYSIRFLDHALYCSDSNFGRSYEDLVAAFNGTKAAVHLLIHPINWVAGGDSMLEVFKHAWPFLIREAELEARTNRAYSSALPEGIPDSLLDEFSRRWRETAG
jgi:hypothetical protein